MSYRVQEMFSDSLLFFVFCFLFLQHFRRQVSPRQVVFGIVHPICKHVLIHLALGGEWVCVCAFKSMHEHLRYIRKRGFQFGETTYFSSRWKKSGGTLSVLPCEPSFWLS